MKLAGVLTALITPFHNNEIDLIALTNLVTTQIALGVNGFVVCGTTGEASALNYEEREAVIKTVIELAKEHQLPVIVGCGTASLQQTVAYMEQAKTLGATAALIVAPYYVKPTQEGLIAYIEYLHNSIDLPIVLYNNPGRTVVQFDVETITRLSQLPRVIGIKDSSTDLARMHALKHNTPSGFALLSGEDSMLGAHLLYGCQGVISFCSNVFLKMCKDVVKTHEDENYADLIAANDKWLEAVTSLSYDMNPSTIKYAVSCLGLCKNELRLPLTMANTKARTEIDKAIAKFAPHNIPR